MFSQKSKMARSISKEIFRITCSFILTFLFLLSYLPAEEECTTAVFSGKATVDGRPLLWKNRDTNEDNNEVVFVSGGIYDVVGVINAGNTSSIFMGINSAGFAIENSLSLDLEGPDTGDNAVFMKQALQNCATIEKFEQLLIATNAAGRRTKSNYGVIDASGAAAIFETGNHTFTKYDAHDIAVAPEGFIVRTNFAWTGDGSGGGHTRYYRALELFNQRISESKISHEFILKTVSRDLRNDKIDPYPLPYPGSQDERPAGFIRTNYSINRYKTRSCVVFHGVLPGEDPRLSTMWVILGEPVCAIAIPIWILAGSTPPEMNGIETAPMCDVSKEKDRSCYPLATSPEYLDTYALDDGFGGGTFSCIRPIEDWIFAEAAPIISSWRATHPTLEQVVDFEYDLIAQAYACFLTCIAPSDTVLAPLQLTCNTAINRGLFYTENVHILSWQHNPDNTNISAYRAYRLEGQSLIFITEVDGSMLECYHRGVDINRHYTYVVTAVDAEGQEGNPAITTISGN